MSHTSPNTLYSDNGTSKLLSKELGCTARSNDTVLHDTYQSNINMRHRQVENRRQVNLESHQLVWFDPDFNRKNAASIENLRKIVDYTKLFENNKDCLEYIEQTQNTDTFLVCTKEFAQEFILQIHHFKHISKIYVLCESENHQEWLSNYSKVRTSWFLYFS